jgi:hypothetical protein
VIFAKQTNNQHHEEWYNCQRCDVPYPRSKVVVQKGLIVCHGINTNNCWDEPGRDALVKQASPLPTERPIDNLPEDDGDI